MNSPTREERVLIIDDDTELCELVTEYLEMEGFGVEVIHDGTHAVERAVSGTYRLIILDVMLPGASGFEVLRTIRSQSQMRSCWISRATSMASTSVSSSSSACGTR